MLAIHGDGHCMPPFMHPQIHRATRENVAPQMLPSAWKKRQSWANKNGSGLCGHALRLKPCPAPNVSHANEAYIPFKTEDKTGPRLVWAALNPQWP